MAKGFIVAGSGSDQRRVPISPVLLIGRAECCGLKIKDPLASREHLEVRASEEGYICRDLGSSNGTLVNGKRITRCRLQHGDRIRVGDMDFQFEIGEEPEEEVSGRTVFLQTVLDPEGREQKLPPPSRSKELLEAAYTLMNALAANFNACDLVDRVLQTTTEAINAQRGAVVFAGENGKLRPCDVCGRVHTIREGKPHPADVEDIQISETVAQRVLKDGENVLYQGGMTDTPWDSSKSIQALKLSSILCVPIRTQNAILGILYVDTDMADRSYTQDDMLLAAAAGNSAGLALEN
ncbi:MAG: FHA domain-containing protein, partial [bacterium]|nr:FHA domain-containing protein [bacterium]